MIYVYWPFKRIPHWLERIEAAEKGAVFPEAWHHKGFGIVVNINGKYIVWGALGTFCYARHGKQLLIIGGGDGVLYSPTFAGFLQQITIARGTK